MANKGDLSQLRIAPAGEALLQPDLVRLLKSRTLSDNGVHTTIITNLTTITSQLWNDIKHNKITFQCSLDGATKHTYEKIRVGSTWEKVYNKLLFLVDVHKKGELHGLTVNYVVMGSNRHDIGRMIELTMTLGVELFFIKHEGLSCIEDNVFDCCDIRALDEIYDEIEGYRGFKLPHVHLGSIAGILDKRYYRSLDYRMMCADLQVSRYRQWEVAARIVRQCVLDIERGALEAKEEELSQYASFIDLVRGKARRSEQLRRLRLLLR
jgi:hypothetical protein